MSTRSASTRRASTARAGGGRGKAQPRRTARRRSAGGRVSAVIIVAALAGMLAFAVAPLFHNAVQQLALPLRHEDIIRQQARDKRLDASLIAAVIYAESHFRDGQTSSAGAKGLMQLTPETAQYIARKSGGYAFELKDLGTPQVNISYGAYYLRYLLIHYAGNTTLALAAYNGGEGNVDRWVAEHGGQAGFTAKDIPFSETRAYVQKVLDARTQYRAKYASELGLTG